MFRRISDAFCVDMLEKFRRAEPHTGYLDLVEILAQWKAGSLSESPSEGRELLIGTTSLDKLAVRAFHGVAKVHEINGDINRVRRHTYVVAPRQSEHSVMKAYAQAKEKKAKNFVDKPLVMHLGERY